MRPIFAISEGWIESINGTAGMLIQLVANVLLSSPATRTKIKSKTPARKARGESFFQIL